MLNYTAIGGLKQLAFKQRISEHNGCDCNNTFRISVSDVAQDREVEGDLLLGDMGQGMPFRPGTFDGCVRYQISQMSCHFLRIHMESCSLISEPCFCSPSVFQLFSGFATLTSAATVLPRDFTLSLVLSILHW